MLGGIFGKKTHALNTIYLDLRRLLQNLEYLQSLHPNDAYFPVIKSNAYGHGLKEIATILKDFPTPYLCVDSFPEYKIASAHNNHNYLVLSDTNTDNYRLYNWKRTAFVVSSFHTLEYFIKKGKSVRLHIFINTGMNREGFDEVELPTLLEMLKDAPHIHIEGVLSHLAYGDDAEFSRTQVQIDQFKKMHEILTNGGLAPRYRHIGASAGVFTISDPFFTAWRVGKSMYGYSPLASGHPHAEKAGNLSIVARITSSVLTTRSILAGSTVGYGGTWLAKEPTHISLIPFGYYEGLPRGLSNQWSVKRKDTYLPVIGTISMNYHTVSTMGNTLEYGDEVEIYSRDPLAPNCITKAAILLHTNNYEIMTRFNEKIRRVIKAE